MFKRTPLAHSISCILAASAISAINPALAQDQAVTGEQEELAIEEVIVTGSRIKRDSFSSSTPIDVVLTEDAGPRGIADVATLLQSTTIAAGSPQVNAATSTAFVQDGGTGTSTLSLRGLGPSRTLTLLNGRRAGPAGTRGAVSSFDLNVIPLAAIERIEVLKDGASSIYGSDAVAGVVNIITRKDDGGTAEAYVGVPEESGGEEYRFNASWGASGERGRFRVTLDYHKQEELRFGQREFLKCGEQYMFDPETGERADVIDPRTGQPACYDAPWGHVWLYDFQDPGGNVPTTTSGLPAKAQYDYDGDLGQYASPFEPRPDDPFALTTPPGWYAVGYDRESDGVYNNDHPFQDASTFDPETELTTFFGDGELNLTDTMQLYGEVLMNRRQTMTNGYRQFWAFAIYNAEGPCFGTNPLSEGWGGCNFLSPTPVTDHFSFDADVDYQRYVAGLTGEFGKSWFWDLSAQYSKSDGDYTQDVIYADSIYDQEWLYGSCEGMVTSVRGVPCQDIPWLDPSFLAGDIDPAMREFLFGTETGNTEYTQWSVEGFVSGDLFSLPAGTVAGAFGFQYRDDEIRDVPGDVTLAGNSWNLTSAGITAGSDKTKALFAEFDIPIISGKTGFEYLGLNVSGRWTDVESYGDDTTYKAALDWQFTPTWRLRASHGTSFRAPALFELYLADQTGFLGQRSIDPCINWGASLDEGGISQRVADNCAATTTPDYPDGLPEDFPGGTTGATVISGGGLGVLEAETSDATTIGLVWQPQFANLQVSVDYFDIEVNDQVDQVGANGIVGGCYNSEFFPTDPLCALFDRTGLNSGVDHILDSYINVATQSNKGWDVAAQWIVDLWGGTFTLDTQHTFQDEAITALFEDTVRDNNGQFGDPEWVGRLWLRYDRNDWSYFWGIDGVGKVSNHEHYGGGEYKDTATYRGEEVRVVLSAPAFYYHSFSVTKFFSDDRWKAVLGVRNAFDKSPPRVTTLGLGELNFAGGWTPLYSQYDYFGRSFYGSLTWNF